MNRSSYRTRSRRKVGYTLIEVTIASVILATSFAAMFGAIGQGVNMVEMSRDYTRISQILQSEVETLRTMKWTDLNAIKKYQYSAYKPSTNFDSAFNNKYTVFRIVYDRPTGSTSSSAFYPPFPGMLRVTLWISYNAPGGLIFKRIYTDFTEDGLNDFYYRNV